MFEKFRELRWRVSAAEPNPDFHEAAIQAALACGFEAPRRMGFDELAGESEFDLVTAINDSFAHLLSGEERAQALHRVFRILRPGGVLFIDVPNFLWILKNYQSPRPLRSPVPGGEVVLERAHEIDFHRATFTTVECYQLDRQGIEHRLQMRHVYAITSLPELEHQLHSAGYTDLETYGSYSARAVEPVRGSRILLSAVRAA
jgi:SAM-dependent methyltransferase